MSVWHSLRNIKKQKKPNNPTFMCDRIAEATSKN